MASGPLVSVIIPTYNRRQLLVEALESVLRQTHTNLEILVVDDGSDDGTEAYVRQLGSDRVIHISLEHQGRPAPARNVGLKRAKGEFVAFLDSDDQWQPRKTEVQLQAFHANPELDLVASDFIVFPARRPRAALGLERMRPVLFRDLLRDNPIQNSSVMLRRSVVDAVGLLNEAEDMRGIEDYEYWLRIVRHGSDSAAILPEPLVLYRRHDGNIGIQDVAQCDRLASIVTRHRDFDEAYVNEVLEELDNRKAFRQALVDVEQGNATLVAVLRRHEVRISDRFRLVKQRIARRAQSLTGAMGRG